MGPKYEFTGEQMNYDGFTLHRIKRLSDGKIGGWIEKESNLSQDGSCWVDNNAKVFDEACVYGNAQIFDNAKVYVCAKVYGDAKVFDNALVISKAEVFDTAHVYGNAEVFWSVKIYGEAKVYGNAKVCGDAKVHDNAQVSGNAKVYDKAEVYDKAWVGGSAQVYGDTKVFGNIAIGLEINSEEYNDNKEDSSKEESVREVIRDFIYKVDELNKITTQTEYDSIEEFFNEPITNDIKLDTVLIYTVDTKEPLIKLQKVEKENKLNYRFIVDITIDNGDNFSIKSTIETQEQLNQKLEQTIEALKQYPEFAKYVDDLESCL